jgi:hypothetical protein
LQSKTKYYRPTGSTGVRSPAVGCATSFMSPFMVDALLPYLASLHN